MEGHPEEDDHGKYEAECHDALLGFFLAEFFYGSGIGSLGILLLAALGVTECATEQVIDSDRQNERGASHSKREVVGIVAAIAQRGLGILLDLDSGSRCKQGTYVDGHIEDGEACIALVGILRGIVEIAHHYLQVALEETRAEAYEQQGAQHDDEGKRVATQRNAEQQIACKHDDDARGDHLAKAELIGQHATNEGEEIH